MRYKIKIVVKAETTYEVEVEGRSEMAAENAAIARWRQDIPSDFADRAFVTEVDAADATQLSWECQECGTEITRRDWERYDEMCVTCYETAEFQNEVK